MDYIKAYWFSSNNFGDNINSTIISTLSKKQVCLSQEGEHYIVCGSILSLANEKSTVWGAGFHYDHHSKIDLNGCLNVVAVRGDLTAERTGMSGLAIGDPALLLPTIYSMSGTLKRRVGIVPHWSNIEKCMLKYPGYFIINPLLPPDRYINDLLSCEYVFSESLHGLIVSDVYNVKNAWVSIDTDIDNFKYRDYYSSTLTPETKPIQALDVNSCQVHKYKYNLDTFLKSCPFYGSDTN